MKEILIVDDDPQILKMLTHILVREGYKVSTVSDGKKALAFYKSHPVDLIITDIRMPNKDGLEFIAEIKYDHPDIKIIAISGDAYFGDSENIKFAQKFGAIKYFTKPIDRKTFITTIKEVLSIAPSSPTPLTET